MHINLNAMGTRMKRRRKELKMSQAELAEKVNVSNNHIYSIETGKQIPSLTTFVKICEQLDTTPDFLLLGSLHTDNLPKIFMILLPCATKRPSIDSGYCRKLCFQAGIMVADTLI